MPLSSDPARAPWWHLLVPKLFTVLAQGYRLDDLKADALAGMTVAVVAIPLAMALAIASGATPDKGLLTVVVAGFLISALGGSRFQIGGPTGAFVVVVFNVIAQHGFDGLILATLMAGAMLVLAGLLRLGTLMKYIPEPVVVGFTAGIAAIILLSQVKDFFGLMPGELPGDILGRLGGLWAARDTLDLPTLAVAGGGLAVILLLRRFGPRVPGFLVCVVAGGLMVWGLDLPVDTVGSRFGSVELGVPTPTWPEVSLARLAEMLPSAFTIAFLAGVESLLSAVVADGMTGRRHRANCELVAQGVANSASALFGGLPATGAIARTVTNIRSGGRTPVAGMLHALIVMAAVLLAAPLIAHVPLASLAAVLVVVAWNMSELGRIRQLMRGPWGDRLTLVVTLGLTVLVDLTVAIEVGVVLAALLFMHRMSELVALSTGGPMIAEDVDDLSGQPRPPYVAGGLPPGVEAFRLSGPLFFGVASRIADLLDSIAGRPRVFLLGLDGVPMIDATGASKLADLAAKCRRHGTRLILTGLADQPARVLADMGVLELAETAPDFEAAVAGLGEG
ncbi:SulP family inorganic anion transporter [Roseospirillum parvum]|uniref:Sulfate permease, SulP family n=1 Tax=Roseospirillum parvum TaxID=83401 RepID=A0A1G8EID2_9PROT|nr:SulP family inorganic anion transporter [Roseospirillum parvum]SDH69627.1 sulfate permease, SulP family [Roseospirillum parvum]